MTTAEEIAELFDHDGQNFRLFDGQELEEVALAWGAEAELAPHRGGDVVRYRFNDDSAIVTAGDAWDIEGDKRFSWASAR